MRLNRALLILFVIQLLMFGHSFVEYDPRTSPVFQFFPFNDDAMSLRGYVWRICNRINILLFYYCMALIISRYRRELYFFVIMEVFIVIEFFLNYNSPWILGFGVTHFCFVFKCIIFLRVLWEKLTYKT